MKNKYKIFKILKKNQSLRSKCALVFSVQYSWAFSIFSKSLYVIWHKIALQYHRSAIDTTVRYHCSLPNHFWLLKATTKKHTHQYQLVQRPYALRHFELLLSFAREARWFESLQLFCSRRAIERKWNYLFFMILLGTVFHSICETFRDVFGRYSDHVFLASKW